MLLLTENALEAAAWPRHLMRDLRSDHAGETGAVAIYRGILAVSRDAGVREFARFHQANEEQHLEWFENNLPRRWHTRLVIPWRIAGWLTGAIPALLGPRWVFATVSAVETFVDGHYREQVEKLGHIRGGQALQDQLEAFRLEEVEHRDDAARRFNGEHGWLLRRWCALVGWGSKVAVGLARRI